MKRSRVTSAKAWARSLTLISLAYLSCPVHAQFGGFGGFGFGSAVPSESPSEAPVAVASVPPSMAPIIITPSPSKAPTAAPTMVPTMAPTMAPTKAPTSEPTLAPVAATPAPTDMPTDVPTVAPTKAPTSEPTLAPTSPPTEPVEKETSTSSGIRMILVGMNEEMNPSAIATWRRMTAEHVENFFNDKDLGVSSMSVSVQLEEQTFTAGRRRVLRETTDRKSGRALQTGQLEIKYTQESNYVATADDVDPEDLALRPFQSLASRTVYVDKLRGTAVAAFASLQEVEQVDLPPEEEEPEEEESSGMSTGAIIGIVVGGGGGILILAILCFFQSREGESDPAYAASAKKPPAQVETGGGGDEPSNLPEPKQRGAPASAPAPAGTEGQPGDQSVATVDYDYSKAYGGGGDTSVSSAGGTFGSNTQAQSAADATGAAAGSVGSFESKAGGNSKEELIDIYAPPGKLGVVIDTPDDGAPVVHAVKDTSVIYDKLQVGDKLVAVDDEDVRSMTAIKVSKLISRKSTNPTRKLSIIRTVALDE